MAIENTLLIQAIREVRNLYYDEVFIVRDLFKGYEWKRIPLKTRLRLGRLFLNYVKSNNFKIKPVGKTSLGQQKYKVNRQ